MHSHITYSESVTTIMMLYHRNDPRLPCYTLRRVPLSMMAFPLMTSLFGIFAVHLFLPAALPKWKTLHPKFQQDGFNHCIASSTSLNPLLSRNSNIPFQPSALRVSITPWTSSQHRSCSGEQPSFETRLMTLQRSRAWRRFLPFHLYHWRRLPYHIGWPRQSVRDGSDYFFAQQLFFRIVMGLVHLSPDTLIGLDPITKRCEIWFYRTTGCPGLSSEARLR